MADKSFEELLQTSGPGEGDDLMKDLDQVSAFDRSVGEDTDKLLGLSKDEEEGEEEQEAAGEEEEEGKEQEAAGEEEEEGKEKEAAGEEEEEGVGDDDIDAAIEKHLSDRNKPDDVEDKRRQLLLGQREQQQTQQTQEKETEGPQPIDYAAAKNALVSKLGDDYKEVADALEIYLKPIIEQSGEHMQAIVGAVMQERQAQAAQVRNQYTTLADNFYQAYPELATPGGRKLVLANHQELVNSGRSFADEGALLYEVGKLSLQQLAEIKAGSGQATKQPTKKKTRTQKESLGKSAARSRQQEEEQAPKSRSVSDRAKDELFKHYSDRYADTGVQGFVN